jgi:ABC-type glycerol-3-phosphate transport system permease component
MFAMSEPFMIQLIAVTLNLAGTLVVYSFMAFFLARLQWRGRGVLAVLITIIIAEVFWILPAIIGLDYAYSFFFGNWLVSAFAIVLFCQTVKGIPRQLEDSTRLDGCGWFGTYWHVVLPLVRRDLGFIASLIVMATTLPFLTELTRQGGIDCYPSLRLSTYDFANMLAMSAITSLPVIAILMTAKRPLRHTNGVSGTPSVLSPH